MPVDYIAARHEPEMKNTAQVRFLSWQIG